MARTLLPPASCPSLLTLILAHAFSTYFEPVTKTTHTHAFDLEVFQLQLL